MSKKLTRREMLKITAAGAAAVGANAIPGAMIFAAPPKQDSVTLCFQENETEYAAVIEAFKEEFPNVNIEFVNVTGIDHAEVASKILAQLAAGQPVEISICISGTNDQIGRKVFAVTDGRRAPSSLEGVQIYSGGAR